MPETKVRMLVSIAGTVAGKDFSAQPQQVVSIDSKQAEAWLRSGHAEPVPQNTPLSESDEFHDLSMEEALLRVCSNCNARQAQFVLRNRPFCAACYQAFLNLED